jgi:L-lactate dehydrogenase (cytochrome)
MEGRAWFQLYHPADLRLRDQLLERAAAAKCPVLVLLCDVPGFGYRPRDIRNGLAMPPRMTVKNIWQIMGKPRWAWNTLRHGSPAFETMKPYMPKGMGMKQLGLYMDRTFSGRLDADWLAAIRDRWKGKLVLKGVATVADADIAMRAGLDGLIVSNHGGRQLDAGSSAISSLQAIVKQYQGKMTIMMDSGLRSGPDIARALATGAQFTFLGRSFMYSVAALGKKGGEHALGILKTQLRQVMEQVSCERPEDLAARLVRR